MNIKGTGALLVLAFSLSSAVAQEQQIAPPEVKVIDDIGVNLATGQVTASLETVAIGGSLGLAHGISMHSNNYPLSHGEDFGYIDRFTGDARYERLSANGLDQFKYDNNVYPFFQAMRVFGPVGTKNFVVYINGVLDVNVTQAEAEAAGSNYTYEAMGDKRHLLEVVRAIDSDNQHEGHLRWTTPDGTRLYYTHGDTATYGGQLVEIVYPNGLTVTRHALSSITGSVTTNTGYQLKYQYPEVSNVLSQEKKNIKSNLPESANLPPVRDNWPGNNPASIVGINNAIEYCSPEYSRTPCSLHHEWPTATFDWPGGMPQAIFLGDSIFKVTDAAKRTTEYHYQAQDVCVKNLGDEQCVSSSKYEKNERWSPRLIGIKSAESKVINYSYTYENDGDWTSIGAEMPASYDYWKLSSDVGKLKFASGPKRSGSYAIDTAGHTSGDKLKNVGPSGLTVIKEDLDNARGSLYEVESPQHGKFKYYPGYENFIETAYPINGPTTNYTYERGNLIRIAMSGEPNDTEIIAKYPDNCTEKADAEVALDKVDIRKSCNKPLWVKDAMGHQTDYTYHDQSGQVETITKPANRFGIRPQTRYEYDEFYAYYKKNGGAVERADTPVWLLTREAYCISSQATANGCSASHDEVVTEYDYGPQNGEPNNLQLRGVKVIAPIAEVRRTCYEYDKYGNRIGETPPKGNCPQ